MRTLKIQSLPDNKQWVDKDFIMLHVCFQLLVDCVEEEEIVKRTDYETHQKEIDEVNELYQWWQNNKENEDLDEDKEAQEMLLRLIKIRRFLWT